MGNQLTAVRGASRDYGSVYIEVFTGFETADKQLLCTGHINNRTNMVHLSDDQTISLNDRGLDEYEIIRRIKEREIEII